MTAKPDERNRRSFALYADNGMPVRLIDYGASVAIVSRLGRIETRNLEHVQFWLRLLGVTQAPAMLIRKPSIEGNKTASREGGAA